MVRGGDHGLDSRGSWVWSSALFPSMSCFSLCECVAQEASSVLENRLLGVVNSRKCLLGAVSKRCDPGVWGLIDLYL